MTTLRGRVSWFGGPEDMGVDADEDLAFIYDVSDKPELFLDYQPNGTTGLARRLDPDKFYIACRWNYNETSKIDLLGIKVLVRAPSTGLEFVADPADWGPHDDTERIADISPGLMAALGIKTDDEVEVVFPYYQEGAAAMPYQRIVISSGHGLYVRGAHGIIDEVDEAREVVETLAKELRHRDVEVVTFHDDVSKSQNENLNRIVDFHNAQQRDLDISVHFNAFEQCTTPKGTEVWFYANGKQADLANRLSAAMAAAGEFINRGGKGTDDLFFLSNTAMPSVLLEVCFVDSAADCELYEANYNAICKALADVLGGDADGAMPEPPVDVSAGRIDMQISGNVTVVINGKQVYHQG